MTEVTSTQPRCACGLNLSIPESVKAGQCYLCRGVNSPPSVSDALLTWEIKPGGWQRVATDEATGLRFVITQCAAAEATPTEWEVEQSAPGQRIVLDYFPTLTNAVRECNLRAGKTDA